MFELSLMEWLLLAALVLLLLTPVRATAMRGSRNTPPRHTPEDEDEQLVRLILKEHARITAASRQRDSEAE